MNLRVGVKRNKLLEVFRQNRAGEGVEAKLRTMSLNVRPLSLGCCRS